MLINFGGGGIFLQNHVQIQQTARSYPNLHFSLLLEKIKFKPSS